MPRPTTHEWDWPPPRSRKPAPEIEGRVIRERVRYVRTTTKAGWNSPKATKFADAFLWTVVQAIKVIIAIPIAGMVLGAVWLLTTLLTLPK